MGMFNQQELQSITRQLQAHRAALQTHLRGLRHSADGERYTQVAGPVHDQGDESFAELSTALSNASLGREAEALQDTEEALQRLRSNSYGYCVDCGRVIERKRLHAYPIAKRCLQCQRQHENKHSEKDSTPSL